MRASQNRKLTPPRTILVVKSRCCRRRSTRPSCSRSRYRRDRHKGIRALAVQFCAKATRRRRRRSSRPWCRRPRKSRRRRLDVADRGATRDVGHPAIEGVAEAATNGREEARSSVSQVRPAPHKPPVVLPLMFDQSISPSRPNDPGAELPIVADRAADQTRRRRSKSTCASSVPCGTAPGAAAVYADIETRPIVDRGNIGRRLVAGAWRGRSAAEAVPTRPAIAATPVRASRITLHSPILRNLRAQSIRIFVDCLVQERHTRRTEIRMVDFPLLWRLLT